MSAFRTLYLMSALFSRKTEGCAAFCAITEDIGRVIAIAALGLTRGIKGKEALERVADLQKSLVFFSAFIDVS